MGRRSKKRKRASQASAIASSPLNAPFPPGVSTWSDEQGFHQAVPLPMPLLQAPDLETQRQMTLAYQESLRNSPGWGAMVQKYGLNRAEELLQQCRVEFR